MERVERKAKPLPAVCQATIGTFVELPKRYGQKIPPLNWALMGFVLLSFLVILALVETTQALAFLYLDSLPRGNLESNLSNGGFVAEGAGGWFYLSDAPDGTSGLYKAQPISGGIVKIAEGRISSINVSGKWVYYVLKDGDLSDLYKIPIEGGEPVLVKPGCRYTVVIGDTVYFTDLYGMVGKMKKDGSGEKSLGTDTTSFLYIRHFCIFHSWNVLGQNTLVCASITDEIELLKDISRPVADGKWIYLTKEDSDSDYGALWRINADNLKPEPLSDVPCSMPFPVEDWVYINCEDGIYRINKDGTGKTKISEDHYTAINQAGDWLLFRSAQTGKLMKMNLDGSDISPFWE